MLAPHPTPFNALPFEHGRVFDTTDLDEARERCAPILNEPTLSLVMPRQSRPRTILDHVRIGSVSLVRLSTSAPIIVDPGRLDNYYALIAPLRGRATFEVGSDKVDVAPGHAAIVSAMPRFRIVTENAFEQIVIRIDKDAVSNSWEAISGQAPSRPIDFAGGLPMMGRAWAAVEPVLGMMSHCALGPSDLLCLPKVAARLQDSLVTALLLSQPHSLALPRERAVPSSPKYQRLAEAYMLERLGEPIALSEVAAACGISSRALQATFHRKHDCGPMQWLRRQRLKAVHAALLASTSERPSIVHIAMSCGFAHLGEFSRAYREAFHETPTQTLGRRS